MYEYIDSDSSATWLSALLIVCSVRYREDRYRERAQDKEEDSRKGFSWKPLRASHGRLKECLTKMTKLEEVQVHPPARVTPLPPINL